MANGEHPKRLGNEALTRRGLFERVSGGIYGAALTYLLSRELCRGSGLLAAETTGREQARRRSYDLEPRAAHFEPRARAVIHLFMNGGPSQMDLFDPKPMLESHHGEQLFDKIAGDVENTRDAGALMKSP